MKYGLVSNAAGGTHPASCDQGASNTIIDDLAVVVTYIVRKGCLVNVACVLVINLDVYQSKRTAKFDDVDGLFLLIMHCAANYPVLNSWLTYDIELPVGVGNNNAISFLVVV